MSTWVTQLNGIFRNDYLISIVGCLQIIICRCLVKWRLRGIRGPEGGGGGKIKYFKKKKNTVTKRNYDIIEEFQPILFLFKNPV